MLRGIVSGIVDAEHDGDVLILRGRGDDDFLDRSAQMFRGILRVGETAGGFDDDLDAERTPVEFGRILDGEDLDLPVADDDGIAVDFDILVEVAEDGIVLRQMGEGFGVGEVVDGDEFDLGVVERCANHVAADTAKTVDAYFDRHEVGCVSLRIRSYGDVKKSG